MSHRSDDRPSVDRQEKRQLTRLSAVGIEMGMSVAIGSVGGYYLDEKFDTAPVLVIIGTLLGSAAGFKSLITTMLRTAKQERERDEG